MKTNTIVSAQSGKYFNFLLFMAYRKDLQFLSSFTWRRVTDLFRLFPNCRFVQLKNEYSTILFGINTLSQYLEVKEIIGSIGKPKLNKEAISTIVGIKRSFELNGLKVLNHIQQSLTKLELAKCYFLMVKIYQKTKIEGKIQESEYYMLESELWKGINEIIYLHCIKDSLN